jgi:hypothetical protein
VPWRRAPAGHPQRDRALRLELPGVDCRQQPDEARVRPRGRACWRAGTWLGWLASRSVPPISTRRYANPRSRPLPIGDPQPPPHPPDGVLLQWRTASSTTPCGAACCPSSSSTRLHRGSRQQYSRRRDCRSGPRCSDPGWYRALFGAEPLRQPTRAALAVRRRRRIRLGLVPPITTVSWRCARPATRAQHPDSQCSARSSSSSPANAPSRHPELARVSPEPTSLECGRRSGEILTGVS